MLSLKKKKENQTKRVKMILIRDRVLRKEEKLKAWQETGYQLA